MLAGTWAWVLRRKRDSRRLPPFLPRLPPARRRETLATPPVPRSLPPDLAPFVRGTLPGAHIKTLPVTFSFEQSNKNLSYLLAHGNKLR